MTERGKDCFLIYLALSPLHSLVPVLSFAQELSFYDTRSVVGFVAPLGKSFIVDHYLPIDYSLYDT